MIFPYTIQLLTHEKNVMAYRLIGRQGRLILRESDFPQLLRLAIFYGWKPAGTEKPDHMESDSWDSTEYLSCEGQYVIDVDAKKLSKALLQSLRDIPDYDCKNEAFQSAHMSPLAGNRGKREKSLENLIRYFSGDDKMKIQEFIEYTAAGGFQIY
jgi:hypothetical protein